MTNPSDVRTTEVIFPDRANHYGVLFAGDGLALMSKAAFVAASRRARRDVLMARCEGVDFLTPVKVGEVLGLTARVVEVGRTSMTVEVEAEAETPATGARRPALKGRFIMIAVDDDKRPVEVPPEA